MSVDARLHVNPTGALLDAARDCEAEVFERWYGNSREELEVEYGPYEEVSVFVAVTDSAGDVGAAMRLLQPGGAAGLKTLTDIAGQPWHVDGLRSAAAAGLDLAHTWEVATVSSRRRLGATGLRHSFALYYALGAIARVNAMTDFVAILDQRVRRLLDSVGLVTRALPGTKAGPYLGSPASTPIFANVHTMLRAQRQEHPDSFALVTLGNGLDGVAVPPDDAFRLTAVPDTVPTSWSAPGALV
ncbi:hypothetical protein Q6348_11810 [Isoptericola sp. b441]|uniref:Uncharacterized protein n=1 Tax=Actinotalea lenta TaxID=3064654 RepID=A0ABT9DAI9_9CELL|nr:hypothetical protein [Isoptericola sp. b441]MDO8107881.1 hypothetical protein [Isoptericola sp. b441]